MLDSLQNTSPQREQGVRDAQGFSIAARGSNRSHSLARRARNAIHCNGLFCLMLLPVLGLGCVEYYPFEIVFCIDKPTTASLRPEVFPIRNMCF